MLTLLEIDELLERTRRELRTRLALGSIPARGPLDAIAHVVAGAEHGINGNLAWAVDQIGPETADAERLDLWGVRLNRARKAAAYSSGTLVFTGATNGTSIPSGTLFARADGAQYVATASAVVVAGTANVAIQAVAAGAAGDSPTSTKLTVGTAIAGLPSSGAVLTPGISGGADQESDEDYRARLIAAYQAPPSTGTVADYVRWTLEVAGVTRAWAIANNQGVGSVGVTFVRDDDPVGILPTTDEVAAVLAYLRERAPAPQADPNAGLLAVFAPTLVAQAFTVHVSPDNAATRASVTASLEDLLLRRGGPGATIYLSNIREAVSLSAGEVDSNVVSPSADLVYGAGEVPILGVVTFV